ncbi:hypothetical protein C0W66_21135 [Photobacterium kishitanii]|nr:hypothetical protein AYY23_20010 [Photobacterium kishitanii]PSW46892.1 hypothetical protein C0W66_21135 [Photobacterium kishitanii]
MDSKIQKIIETFMRVERTFSISKSLQTNDLFCFEHIGSDYMLIAGIYQDNDNRFINGLSWNLIINGQLNDTFEYVPLHHCE